MQDGYSEEICNGCKQKNYFNEKLEQIKALGTGDPPITKPKAKSQILEAVHETASDLHSKLKAFDPTVHGGEVMATGRVGAEVF